MERSQCWWGLSSRSRPDEAKSWCGMVQILSPRRAALRLISSVVPRHDPEEDNIRRHEHDRPGFGCGMGCGGVAGGQDGSTEARLTSWRKISEATGKPITPPGMSPGATATAEQPADVTRPATRQEPRWEGGEVSASPALSSADRSIIPPPTLRSGPGMPNNPASEPAPSGPSTPRPGAVSCSAIIVRFCGEGASPDGPVGRGAESVAVPVRALPTSPGIWARAEGLRGPLGTSPVSPVSHGSAPSPARSGQRYSGSQQKDQQSDQGSPGPARRQGNSAWRVRHRQRQERSPCHTAP